MVLKDDKIYIILKNIKKEKKSVDRKVVFMYNISCL